MKKRSLTHRNLTGGFVGGVLGILMAHYIHPVLLPFACLIGVLVGFWYEEILDHAMDALITIVMTTIIHIAAFCYDTYVDIREICKGIVGACRALKEGATKLCKLVPKAFKWGMKVLKLIMASPDRFISWYRAVPLHRARTLQWMAASTFWILFGWKLAPIGFHYLKLSLIEPLTHTGNVIPFSTVVHFMQMVLSFAALVLVIVTPTFAINFTPGDNDTKDERRQHEQKVAEEYAKEGAFIFFLKTMLGVYLVGVVMLTMLVLVMTVILGGGLGFVLICCPLIALTWALIQGLNKVIVYNGHWLCVCVTLVVTSVTAWGTYNEFKSETAVWTVALLTGIASGVLSEICRKALEKHFVKNTWIQTLLIEPPSKSIGRTWNVIEGNCHKIGQSITKKVFDITYGFVRKYSHLYN